MVASAGYDGTVRLWHVKTKKQLARMHGHKAPVLCVAWSPEGTILSGARDATVVLWDAATGKAVSTLRGHRGHVTAAASLACVRRPQLFVTGAQDGTVRLWDCRAAASVASLGLHTSQAGSGAVGDIEPLRSASGGGHLFVTAGADKRLCVVDLRKCESGAVADVDGAPHALLHELTEHTDFIYSLTSIGPLVLSGSGNGTLLCHSAVKGRCLWGVGACQTGAVRAIHAGPQALVTASDDGNALAWAM